MKLHSLTLHNFGPFQHETIQLGGLSLLITGENGAGKTTVLDAFNTTMTLGGKNSHYNAAGDNTKRSDSIVRTLPAYCMGAQTHGLLRNHRTRSYVVATYRSCPSDAFDGFLHVGMLCEAQPNDKGAPCEIGKTLGFCMVSQSQEFPLELFTSADAEPGRHSFASEFKGNVKASPFEASIHIEEGKNRHLRNVYFCIFQKEPPDNASATSRLTASMATLSMKQAINSPNEFAEMAIEVSLDTSGISQLHAAAIEHKQAEQLMATLNQLAETALAVQDKANDYSIACFEASCAQSRLREIDLEASKSKHAETSHSIEKITASRQTLLADQKALSEQAQSLDEQIARATEQEIAASYGDPMATERARLGLLKNHAETCQRASSSAASAWSSQKHEIARAAQTIASFAPQVRADIAHAIETAADPLLSIAPHAAFLTAASTPDGSLARERDLAIVAKNKAEENLALAKTLEASLGARGAAATLPESIADALEHLRSALPEANARCLSTAIDSAPTADPAWLEPIERHMGAARFTIIVDFAWEHEAVAKLKSRRHKGRGPHTEIARNDKTREAAMKATPPVSIVSQFKSTDAEAMAFLKARFGSTSMCRTEAEFKTATRGLMQDGRSSNAHTLRADGFSPGEAFHTVFGSAATANAIAQTQTRIASQSNDIAQHQATIVESSSRIDACRLLTSLSPSTSAWNSFSESTSTTASARLAASELESLIAADDSRAHAGDTAKILQTARQNGADARKAKNDAEMRLRESSSKSGQLQGRLELLAEALEDAIAELESDQEKFESSRKNAFDWAVACSASTDAALEPLSKLNQAAAQAKLAACLALASSASSHWRDAANKHNCSEAVDEAGLAPFDESIFQTPTPDACKDIIARTRKASAHCMSRRHIEIQDTLRAAELAYDKLFAGLICTSVVNADTQTDLEIKKLNDIFRSIEFKGVIFQLTRQRHAEYQAHLSAMKRISEMAAASPGSKIDWSKAQAGDRELFDLIKDLASSELAERRDQLASLCHPIRKSEFDIKAYSDTLLPDGTHNRSLLYSLAVEHTKSGGERESAYILLQSLIAASKAGLLAGKAGGAGQGIRILQMDEAFDKLSTHFLMELISFFEESLDVQLLALTPALKAPSLSPCFPQLLNVVAIGRQGKPFVAQLSMQKNDRALFAEIMAAQEHSDIELAAAEAIDGMDIGELLAMIPSGEDITPHEDALIEHIERLGADQP